MSSPERFGQALRMYRLIRNAQPIDIEAGRFLAVGQVAVTLPEPFWWRPRDIATGGRSGILWRGFLEGDEVAVLRFSVVDVSADEAEPSVPDLGEQELAALEETLIARTEGELRAAGISIEGWGPTRLADYDDGLKVLSMSYMPIDPDVGLMQTLVARLALKGRKFVLEGSSATSRVQRLAPVLDEILGSLDLHAGAAR